MVVTTTFFLLPPDVDAQDDRISSRRVVQIPNDSQSEIGLLVRQLGADEYASRKLAANALRRMGAGAIEPLRSALQSTETTFDIEIRMQAKWLLIEIQRDEFRRQVRNFLAADDDEVTEFGLPGWREFADIVGNHRIARRMYINMYEAHEQLFRSLERRSSGFEEEFKVASTSGLRKRTNAGRKLDTLNCLMFLSSSNISCDGATETNTPVTINARTRKLIASQLNRAEMVTYVKSCHNRTEIQSLIGHWLSQSPDDDLSLVNLRITIVENHRLAGQVDFLVSVALAVEMPLQTRVRAIEVLVPLVEPEKVGSLIPPLTPLLNESSLIGRFPTSSGEQLQDVEFRDLVLAAFVVMVNANPNEYGFGFLHDSQNSLDRAVCGFDNQLSREKAFEKWRKTPPEVPSSPDQTP